MSTTNSFFPGANYTMQGADRAQGYDPAQFEECFHTSIKMDYTPIHERAWSRAFGRPPSDIDKRLQTAKIRFTTGMIGVAGRLMNDRDYKMPTADWRSATMGIGKYCKWGIMAEYFPMEEEDYLYEKTADKLSGLSRIMEQAEEDSMAHFFFSNPIGGWQNKPLFAHNHGIIANPDYCVSNFLDGGMPSQTTIAEIDFYGENFLSHEGFRSPKRPVLIMTSHTNARRWRYEYGREENLSPYTPEIVGVSNIPNPTVSFIFYEGYANSIFMQVDYMNKVETVRKEAPPRICIYHTGKWRFWFADPRLVAITGGIV